MVLKPLLFLWLFWYCIYLSLYFRYMLDRESARNVSAKIQDFFFIMAVSNSCMDPLVYGSFTVGPKIISRTFRKIFCIQVEPLDTSDFYLFILLVLWYSLKVAYSIDQVKKLLLAMYRPFFNEINVCFVNN